MTDSPEIPTIEHWDDPQENVVGEEALRAMLIGATRPSVRIVQTEEPIHA